MSPNTQELVRSCLKRDPSAWEEFVRQYASLVYWAIERSFMRYHFPFQREDLDDTFQQVFSHLWEKGLRKAVGVERLEGWLTLVAYRVAADVVRKEKGRGRTLSLEERINEGEEPQKLLGELLPDKSETPREKVGGRLLEEAVEGILNSLSKKEAAVLRLNFIEEKTHAEIAELLKIPIGTIASLIKRTKEKVALLLKKEVGGLERTDV